MRNFLLLLAVIGCIALSVSNVDAQVCAPPSTNLYLTGCTDPDNIESFSTTGGITNITNNNTGCSNTSTGYSYFSSMTHTAVQGATVNFSFTNGGTFTEYYKIWVDFNNNNILDEAGELVYTSGTTKIAASGVVNASFVIPVSTVPGTKRIRVRCVYSVSTFTPCSEENWGEVEDYNLQVIALAACSGTPNAGTATSTITNILCPGANFTLGLSGSDLTSGLNYQWEFSLDNVNWSPIAGATSFNYTTTQTEAIKYYRAVVTCTNAGGGSATSNPVTVTNGSGPTYAPLPFTESFENAWMNTCNTREIPNNSWRNTPGTGENSWRRNDDGGAAAWTTPATGAYTPAASAGTFSARFHSNNAPTGATGRFDLHLNCNTPAAAKRLLFDFINTNGTDSVAIHLSTDGGATYVRLDSVHTSTVWKKKAVVFNSNSATTIIRFIAYSDDGTTDIGIDNVRVTDFDNCTGTPVGGTTLSDAPANICAGVPFNLTVTGQTDANLLTYQWEVSTDGGGTWNPIPGATSETLNITQVLTSQYRLRITCNGGASATSTAVTVTSPPIPNGDYTINKNLPTTWPAPNANFNSFASAIAAMSCGIGGKVTFKVAAGSGPYNEQVILNPIINSSATNTVTFDGNGESISFATSNTERAVIKLKGADHIRITNFVINSTATTNAYGIELYNNADSNVVSNNTINLNTTAAATSLAGIVIAGSETDAIGGGTTTAVMDSNQVINNTITGGYYGITLTATFAGGANGNNLIKGNIIKDFHQYGIYVSGSYLTTIDSNSISRPTRATVSATSFDGIYFTNQSDNARITRNRITLPFGGLAAPTASIPFNGINFNNANAFAGNDNLVINNLVGLVTKTNAAVTGLANTGSSSVSYFNNTISLDETSSTSTQATRGLSVSGTTSGILFYNNMISITRGGSGLKHGIYLGGSLLLGGDYNNIWVSGTAAHFGFYGGNRTTIAAWRTATAAVPLDVSSYAFNPVFVSPTTGDFCSGNAGIDNKGVPLGIPGTEIDINGNTRDVNTPDIGAFECTPPPCNIPPVTGTTTISPVVLCEGLPVTMDLVIGPYGNGQTFQWEFSTDNVTFTSFGDPKYTPDTIFTALPVNTGWFRVKISCTAGAIEYTNSVYLTVNYAFPGNQYTIDKGNPTNYIAGSLTPNQNFNSFNDAYNAMAVCGITGTVDFKVISPLNDPYKERLRIDSLRGTSPVNTVTFRGEGRTITFDPVGAPPTNTERAVIKLVRADHIIFDSLVIDASNGPSYGYGIQLVNNADSNTFRKCRIITSTVSTGSTYNGIVINAAETGFNTTGNTLCDSNSFVNNYITGGFYGVSLVGSATAPIANNRFVGNRIEDFHSTGMYIAGTNNTLLDSNTITRPNRLASTALTGIFSTAAANNGLIITRNSIRNLAGANTAGGSPFTLQQYGIYHNTAQTGAASVVSNNLISDMGGVGIIYAMYNANTASLVHYYNNTVSLDSSAVISTQPSRGLFISGAPSGIEIKNNMITLSRGGTGVKTAVYVDNASAAFLADYNNYYVSGTNAHIGYYPTSNRTTLADWKAATGKETNSLNINPLYRNPAALDYRPALQTLDNLGTTSTSIPITVDILGVFRNSPPDMGAFEFVPVPCDNPPVAGTASVTPGSNICLTDPIVLDITGHSTLGTLTFQWEVSANGTTGWTPVSPVLYGPQFNTVTSTSTYYRAKVGCGGNFVYTNVVQVILNSVVVQGSYTIGNGPTTTWNGLAPVASVNDNFATFQSAVDAMGCGITGPVVFNVVPGTYNEQIRIGNIRNTNATNTVTFQGATGVASDATLTYASTVGTANYTLRLDSASYFRFRNLSINATNATFGRAIEFTGMASNDSIVTCTINAPVVASGANTVAAIYANAFKGSNNIIKGNTVNNGGVGIYWWGTNAATLSLDHKIDSNTVNGAFATGIHSNFQRNMVISRNTVNMSGPLAPTSYGIYVNKNDSSYAVINNRVTISNATTNAYGMYLTSNDRSLLNGRADIIGNTIYANTNNTGTLYGMWIANSNPTLSAQTHYVANNVVSIQTSGAVSYGLYNNNTANGKYYNNTINSTSTSAATTNVAARFENSTAVNLELRNNIFSNKGGGRAAYFNNAASNRLSDYNMYYTSGPVLIQRGTPAANYANLPAWITASRNDKYSIGYQPAFVSNADPRPDLADPNVWAMHGRGTQIGGNSSDINGVYRPQLLTEGVPDLGAYEFFPTVQPTVLTAIPATPAPNTRQVFMYGTDTVMALTWGPAGTSIPASITAQRYSGVPPGDGPYPYTDSMFFYVKLNVPGGNTAVYDYTMNLFYLDPWQGSIDNQFSIGLGRRKNTNDGWQVDFGSVTNFLKKRINDSLVNGTMDRFTGFFNPYAPPIIPEKDSSNRGKRFWVAYPNNNQAGNGTAIGDQKMVLYLSAEEAAIVTVTVHGTTWTRTYSVPSNSVAITEELPKNPALPDNAQLQFAGLFDRGISIESDVPIVAYAHTIGNTSSGATMLLPVGVWGYDYKSLNIPQSSWANSYSYFYVIADEDNTVVEITPTISVQNTGMTASVPYVVTLNQGEVYQVLAQSGTADISGSSVKSIPNSLGICKPVAVYSGTGRTNLTIPCGGGGDFVMQQNFPATAWGKRYLTAPTSLSTGAANLTSNMFRIAVKDPTTQVFVNNAPLTTGYNATGQYYQYVSGTADYITADKPIMVAQYMSGACTGVGDPEMMYISPIEQGIKKVGFFRNNEESIDINYLTMIVPSGGTGLSSLVITDGSLGVVNPDFVYPHPNLPGFSVVIKRWTPPAAPNPAGQQQVFVKSDSAFTGITYGLGSVESYGYNIGTLVKNLRALVGVSPGPSYPPGDKICVGTPFQFTAFLPAIPTKFKWKLGGTANLVPGLDTTINNPVPNGTTIINGVLHYIFQLSVNYNFTNPGFYSIQVEYEEPSIESCDKKGVDQIWFQVLPAPLPASITTAFDGCEGNIATITAATTTNNGSPISEFIWTLPPGGTSNNEVATVPFATAGNYSVKLTTKNNIGCVVDSVMNITVNPRPLVTVTNNPLTVCPGVDTTFFIQSPLPGATYNWYTTSTGGTAITTGGSYVLGPNGTSLKLLNVTAPQTLFIEGISAQNCVSTSRLQVDVTVVPVLTAPVASVTASTANSVTFTWTAVAGAAGYEVSTNGGTTWTTPSSGATGLTHTVTTGTLTQVCLVVRAVGTSGCQTSLPSASVCGCSNSAAVVANPVISVCTGSGATFNIQSPQPGVTYNWYDAPTGGNFLGAGSSFTTAGVLGTTNYYVEQVSGTCTSSVRTIATANILPPLAVPQVSAPDATITVNSITWTWLAVPGAASYQVSLDNGTTWITPSSGATGLSHTVGGLAPTVERCLMVRAVGTIACQTSQSAALCKKTRPDAVFIPNTFTPNGDGKNDVLTMYGWAIQSVQFMVFNQWGEKIHEVNTSAQDGSTGGFTIWDGKYKGKIQPVGVYVYTAKILLKDGTSIEKSGALNIVR